MNSISLEEPFLGSTYPAAGAEQTGAIHTTTQAVATPILSNQNPLVADPIPMKSRVSDEPGFIDYFISFIVVTILVVGSILLAKFASPAVIAGVRVCCITPLKMEAA